MIPFDFEYFSPDTAIEAFHCYHHLLSDHKKPLYYAGGTEIISMARVNSIEFDAVIDVKRIPECNQLEIKNGEFVIGCAQTLTQAADYGAYPLLSKTVKRIADHTIQGKITLGGNLAGTIKYRESALPLMISNSKVKVMTGKGLVEFPFLQIFDGRLQLNDGDLLISISVDENDLHLPYNHVKKTKMDKIDYPLITMAATKNSAIIKAAITGYGEKPLLLPSDILSDGSMKTEKKIKKTIKIIQDDCKSDLSGSKEYKEFVLENILNQMFHNFEKIH